MFTAHNTQANTHFHAHLHSQTETQILILTHPPMLPSSGEEMTLSEDGWEK